MRPLAVALAGLGVLDLLLAFLPGRRAAGAVLLAVVATFGSGVLAGCSGAGSAVLAATVAAESPLWVVARSCWRPRVVLGGMLGCLAARVVTTGLWGVDGHAVLDRWLASAPYGLVSRAGADRVAYVAGALVFLAAAGNTYVRLLLRGVGSRALADGKAPGGGRVIGSIERALIFGLAVAGDATAATLIVSAKGILRFAEVRNTAHDDIDEVTEYVLIGSLASYALALALVPLARA